jgi:hypothetical protein
MVTHQDGEAMKLCFIVTVERDDEWCARHPQYTDQFFQELTENRISDALRHDLAYAKVDVLETPFIEYGPPTLVMENPPPSEWPEWHDMVGVTFTITNCHVCKQVKSCRMFLPGNSGMHFICRRCYEEKQVPDGEA